MEKSEKLLAQQSHSLVMIDCIELQLFLWSCSFSAVTLSCITINFRSVGYAMFMQCVSEDVSVSVGYLCRLNYTLFPLHDVSLSSTCRFQCRVIRRFHYSPFPVLVCYTPFHYTRFPPLSLLHADSVTHRFHYTRIQRSPLDFMIVISHFK